MPLKLTYFKGRGRAEPTRLTLIAGGVDFDDHRIAFPQWQELKPTTPFGGLPVLDKDGAVLAQSDAILRYAGKLAGLYPEDPWAAAKVDEAVAFISDDVQGPLTATFRMPEAEKLAKRKEIVEGPLPAHLATLDKMIGKVGTGFVVGESLTIADMCVYVMVANLSSGVMDGVPTDLASGYEWIQKCAEKVKSEPKIKEYELQQYGS